LISGWFPGPTALDGAAGASLARCTGAVDFARLEADITAACTRVRAWYDRLIARPARRLAPPRPGEPDIDATRESA